MAVNYFTTGYGVQIHAFIINESGGRHGENNIGLLDSAIEHIKNDFYYSTFEEKLTHLVFSVNKGHAFVDGNKRTSIALGAYFLEINGLGYCTSKFIIEMENIAVHVADNYISKDLLKEIITSIINEIEFGEELQLKIIACLPNQNELGKEGVDNFDHNY